MKEAEKQRKKKKGEKTLKHENMKNAKKITYFPNSFPFEF